MKTSDYDYDLPQELIAQTPVEPRDQSRLLVLSRSDGSISHRRFHDLPAHLQAGDLLVFNDSRVVPARIYGNRVGTGGRAELLLLQRMRPGLWRALVRPGRRMGPGVALDLGRDGPAVRAEVIGVEEDGTRLVKLSDEERLREIGVMPLPPYIRHPLTDPERYQTVYAREEGSVAAPTAGLHFTRRLMDSIRDEGAGLAFVTLHVGLDTFQPVKEDDPREHKIHTEYWELNEEAARAVNEARKQGGRVIAVGTTSVRLLEQAARVCAGELRACSGWADLFITPGYRFRVVDAMITNFHLPRSTLLMLVSAFAGRETVFRAYREAICRRYRFYSFGDGMLIA